MSPEQIFSMFWSLLDFKTVEQEPLKISQNRTKLDENKYKVYEKNETKEEILRCFMSSFVSWLKIFDFG